ncbi:MULTISPECIES: LysR substrate-binding domain-containing protein [Pseudomonas]|jgi:DNA-binding transcriptional LysR family regulator|uniref:LysR substrate-binding domain-containing protein n=1 Tax=Pseudomonas TaxID=286 RepID=UPI0005EB605C|nr:MULTISPECIES: LysR substrate-binding domain-containing protein [Pseudomonas]KJK09938.1 LysR family transcriptional regulator [Pseudomonas sp. 5]MDD1978756.1 LysR substrate-binding domain-containing protein [Pseudomonas putida]QYX48453.1 LysR family transcriptional regulator [Pseudomonas sp. S11A 273]
MFAKLPLTALRAFESAARLGSFKAAADEMVVTAAAISYQIKRLESDLGLLLFQRSAQRVTLTPAGEQLYRQVHHGLAGLHQALAALRPACDQQQITLTTTAAFASLWLIPRLGDFHRRHSDIQVRVQTGNEVLDLHRDHSLDLALRAEFNTDPTLYRLPLLTEYFAVYTPPGWQEPPADQPLVLIEAPWVSASGAAINWGRWCKLADKPQWLQRARTHHYDDEHHALQAAIAGHGLVLASNVLVADSLRLGLLQPWREDIRLPAAQYNAVCVPGQERRPVVRMFLDWLRKQID